MDGTEDGGHVPAEPVVRPRPGVIPVAGPWITEREVEAVANAARNSWFEGASVESRAFEEEFARGDRARASPSPCRRARPGSTSA